jgi:hypothetical protein
MLNATAWAYTLDGQPYAACTTIQYGFKPSSHTTTLTVEPQTTHTETPTKTPEQVQIEALNAGWLVIYHEFTWAYPWYRIHAKVTLGAVCFDVGFSPILPFGTTLSVTGFESLSLVLKEITAEIWQDVAIEFIGLFASYLLAKGLAIWNLPAAFITMAIKGGIQYGLFFADLVREGIGSPKMLATAIANIMMGAIAIATSIAETILQFLMNIVATPVLSAFMLAMRGMITSMAPMEVLRTPVDYVESFVLDLPIAVSAWAKYTGLLG